MTDGVMIVYSAVFGLIVGSFLNVCIIRLPAALPLTGRSRCPRCHAVISWYDNIPLVSFILLKAHCRHCHDRISFQYPAVEMVTAGLSVLTLFHVSFEVDTYFIWFLVFICPLIVVAVTDILCRLIPDAITLPGLPAGILVTVITLWPHWTQALIEALGGIALGGGTLLLLGQIYYWIRKREGMGGGDVKLAAMLGAFLGWKGVIFVFFISSLLAILYALVAVIFQRGRNGPLVISYGPFLALAALFFYFSGDSILNFYWNLVIPLQ